MSENHPGGDDLVAAVDDVLAAIEDGYRIVTWYGPEDGSPHRRLPAGLPDRRGLTGTFMRYPSW